MNYQKPDVFSPAGLLSVVGRAQAVQEDQELAEPSWIPAQYFNRKPIDALDGGRRLAALDNGHCSADDCHVAVTGPKQFLSILQRREYFLSGLCQVCQLGLDR